MEELKSLEQLGSETVARFDMYRGEDFILPQVFRDQITEINSSTITYNQYSAIIETVGNQNGVLHIYMPNQWFYIASFFTEYYNELQRYKEWALQVIPDKERFKTLKDGILTQEEENSLITLNISDNSKAYLKLFITNYAWWGGGKTIDRPDFYVSSILNLARLVNASHSYVAELCAFLANKNDLVQEIMKCVEKKDVIPSPILPPSLPLQQIFYGAPGTGKSHRLHAQTRGEDVIRTTFHPDTDYSTFVGAYKPTTREEIVMTTIGTQAVPVKNEDATSRTETKIVYEFVAQSFLQAYIAAWRKIAEASEATPHRQFLIIEEINRGNCAQIFGDLFQLLDRQDSGFSDYPIQADQDMQRQLQKAFSGLNILQSESINALYGGRDVVREVLNGTILLLPNNLYIWGTMNTSDQSLFPIDSAFKRRWDWTYMPIVNAQQGWTIAAGDQTYDWWLFVEKINALIGATTHSEDKKLGYFFCKPREQVISAETFVGKVLFYLWNDVFKDYDFCDTAFNDTEGNKITFDQFYRCNGIETTIAEDKVTLFLHNIGVEPIGAQDDNSDPVIV